MASVLGSGGIFDGDNTSDGIKGERLHGGNIDSKKIMHLVVLDVRLLFKEKFPVFGVELVVVIPLVVE